MRRLLIVFLMVCFVALPVTMAIAMPMAPQSSSSHQHSGDGDCHHGSCDDVKANMCCQMSAAHCGGVFQSADACTVDVFATVRVSVPPPSGNALLAFSLGTELPPPRI